MVLTHSTALFLVKQFAKAMKSAAMFLLMLGTCLLIVLTMCRPNFIDQARLGTSEGLSSWLAYSIEFHPAAGSKEASFTATLTNVSPYALSMDLNDRKFHASFAIKPSTGLEYKVFDREYLGLLYSSTWREPVTVLAPSNSVTWAVPLTSLIIRGGLDEPVTEDSLSGCTVSSEMTMTILPMPFVAQSYVEGNATQRSNSIQIPVMNAGKSDAVGGSNGSSRIIDASRSSSPAPGPSAKP